MDSGNVTTLLLALRDGSQEANVKLYALLYNDIKRLARSRLYASGGVNSLNTTALVNEGFLRIANQEAMCSDSRLQFFAYIGRVFRSVVLDHLRAEQAEKRGGGQIHVTLSHAEGIADEINSDLESLDRALAALKSTHADLYEIVELRFFAGLSLDEIAGLRGESERTIRRDWVKARALIEDHVTA
jgi:RNA polymerase sigma factor (TIGR02999 family)